MQKGDLRKQQILASAEKLFLQRGFEKTSIQDVLDSMKLSKGGFYHHFESKGALLECICRQRTEDALKAKLAQLPFDATAVGRINTLYASCGLFAINDALFTAMLVKAACKSDGASLRAAMLATTDDAILPLLTDAVEKGSASGELHPYESADIAARLLLHLGAGLFEDAAFAITENKPNAMDTVLDCLTGYRKAAEILLGAPYASIALADMKLIDRIRRIIADDPRLQ